jgi:hypothetical protein
MKLFFDPTKIDPALPPTIRMNKHLFNLKRILNDGVTCQHEDYQEWENLLAVAMENYLDVIDEL